MKFFIPNKFPALGRKLLKIHKYKIKYLYITKFWYELNQIKRITSQIIQIDDKIKKKKKIHNI